MGRASWACNEVHQALQNGTWLTPWGLHRDHHELAELPPGREREEGEAVGLGSRAFKKLPQALRLRCGLRIEVPRPLEATLPSSHRAGQVNGRGREQ